MVSTLTAEADLSESYLPAHWARIEICYLASVSADRLPSVMGLSSCPTRPWRLPWLLATVLDQELGICTKTREMTARGNMHFIFLCHGRQPDLQLFKQLISNLSMYVFSLWTCTCTATPGKLKSPPLGTLKWGGLSRHGCLQSWSPPHFKHKSGGVHAGPTHLYVCRQRK